MKSLLTALLLASGCSLVSEGEGVIRLAVPSMYPGVWEVECSRLRMRDPCQGPNQKSLLLLPTYIEHDIPGLHESNAVGYMFPNFDINQD